MPSSYSNKLPHFAKVTSHGQEAISSSAKRKNKKTPHETFFNKTVPNIFLHLLPKKSKLKKLPFQHQCKVIGYPTSKKSIFFTYAHSS